MSDAAAAQAPAQAPAQDVEAPAHATPAPTAPKPAATRAQLALKALLVAIPVVIWLLFDRRWAPMAFFTPHAPVANNVATHAPASAFACTGAAKAALEALHASSDVARRKERLPWTLNQLRSIGACLNTTAPPPLLVEDVCYLVMSGGVTREKAAAVRDTWGQHVAKIWIVSDTADAANGAITFPEIEGRTSYADAQHRQLVALQKLAHSREARGCRWWFLADDDTWVNPHVVADMATGVPEDFPVMIGFLWFAQGFAKNVVIPSGGGGMMYSRAGAKAVADALYTDKCPFVAANDVTLGHCNAALNIPMVHCHACDALGTHGPGSNWQFQQAPHAASWATMHKMRPDQLRTLYLFYQQVHAGDAKRTEWTRPAR